jgi:protein-disulfide isomerase
MALILVFILKVICIECVIMYVANIVLAISLWVALNIPLKEVISFFINNLKAVFRKPSALGFAPKAISHALIVALVFGVGWLIMYNKVLAKGERMGPSVREMFEAHYMQSLYALEVNDKWPIWGTKDAPVTIIEFSEFQCPFCRLSAFNLRPYLQEFKDKVRYFYVQYPLDNNCNPYMTYAMHPKACQAAAASICATEMGADFWNFHDDLFKMQRNITEENLIKLAQKYDLETEKFKNCLSSEQVKNDIQADIEIGKKIHINGVPTIFVNGRKLKRWRNPRLLQKIIREEIKRSVNK